MPAPFASYCIATYRRPELLQKTLESILGQAERDFEIVVSDNDPEGSAESVVAARGDARVRYFRNETNVGMVKNFNRALSHATGEFIVFITDDDPIVPEHLATLRGLQREHPGRPAYFAVGTVNTTDPRLARLYGLPFGMMKVDTAETVTVYPAESFVKALLSGRIARYVLWSCGMVRADVARRFGMPDYGTPFLTDFAYVSLVGSVQGMVLLDRVLGWQTVHPENFGRRDISDIVVAARSFQSLLRAQWPDRDDIDQATSEFLRNWCAGHLVFLFRYYGSLPQKAATYRVAGTIERECGIGGVRRRFRRYLRKAWSRELRGWLRGRA